MARLIFDRQSPDDAWRRFPGAGTDEPASAEYVPALDVVETAECYEVVIDLPGVSAAALAVTFRDGLLIVSGVKAAAACPAHHAAFHLAERSFGQFRRIVRFGSAYDSGRATATLANGELRIVIPRIQERRGQPRTLQVAGA